MIFSLLENAKAFPALGFVIDFANSRSGPADLTRTIGGANSGVFSLMLPQIDALHCGFDRVECRFANVIRRANKREHTPVVVSIRMMIEEGNVIDTSDCSLQRVNCDRIAAFTEIGRAHV